MITQKNSVRLLACTLCIGFSVPSQLAATEPAAATPTSPALHVEVRSSVDDLWKGVKKKKVELHGKRYHILSLGSSESFVDLKKPVDEKVLADQLRHALNAQGYREITGDEKPDILLTVLYGRGYLKNPYQSAAVDDSYEVPVSYVNTPEEAMMQRQIGYESKRQNAQFEKLFITVRALKYPETKGEKPSRLWQTMMILDNPDHYDLNLTAKDMFLVGSQHFDRVLPKEGIVVSSDDPKGRVILAPIRVLGTEEETRPQPKKK